MKARGDMPEDVTHLVRSAPVIKYEKDAEMSIFDMFLRRST